MSEQNKYTTHIHWFGNDLRLSDQPFLSFVEDKAHFFGVYVIDPRKYRWLDLGFRKTGLKRLQFLREHLHHLQQQLRLKGSELIVKVGLPEIILPELILEYKASLSFMKESATEERTVQEKVAISIPLDALINYDANFLADPSGFNWEKSRFPKSFSGFRKKLEKWAKNKTWNYTESPLKLPSSPVKAKTVKESKRQIHPQSAFSLRGGETEGINRVAAYFLNHVKDYKTTRNGLIGMDFSSKFSPYLAIGALSPRFIVTLLKEFEAENGANQSTYWLWFELLWREYFRHAGWVYKDQLFYFSGLSTTPLEAPTNQNSFKKWSTAKVPDSFVKAGLIELIKTGYSSNRMRQNLASFCVHNLKSNWQWGAAWFEHHLLDYDVYSNQGNWMYIAGVAFDPKGGRAFDIRFQAERYDPHQEFQSQWLQESEV